MKAFFISLLSMCAAWEPSVGQDVSLASILESKVSVSINATGISDSVHQLIGATRAEMPEIYGLNFTFKNTQKYAPTPSQQMVLKNEKVRRILDLIGAAYRHDVRYDFSAGTVTFIAASGGEDPQRKYRFTLELSKQMNLDWSDGANASKSIFKHGVIANVEKIDIRERTVTLRGRQSDLDYLDMVIMVYGRK